MSQTTTNDWFYRTVNSGCPCDLCYPVRKCGIRSFCLYTLLTQTSQLQSSQDSKLTAIDEIRRQTRILLIIAVPFFLWLTIPMSPLALSSYDSPHLCLLLPCLLYAPNKQCKLKRSLFFSVLSVSSANPRRFTRKETQIFPLFATALDITEWCTQFSLLHNYTTERRAHDTLDRYNSRTWFVQNVTSSLYRLSLWV
jgi:hypothetical protein